MNTQTIVLIALAAFFAVVASVFIYGYRSSLRPALRWTFGILRFLSLFILLLLLINPRMETSSFTYEKPELIILADNSESIKEMGADPDLRAAVARLVASPELNDKFEIRPYRFGAGLDVLDSLSFDERITNTGKALEDLASIYKKDRSALVLITDGNQTFGRDYEYGAVQLGIPLFAMAVGDSTRYADLAVSRINANRYAFLKNQFPVEVFVVYQGDGPVRSRFRLKRGNEVIHDQLLDLDPITNTARIYVTVEADQVGIRSYTAEVLPLDEEKNRVNNSRQFAVEVIDQATNILLASEMVHPDVGLLRKSIETNQQRQVRIMPPDEAVEELANYQLLILYQPNARYKKLMEEAQRLKINYLLVCGTQTDWGFLNRVQEDFEKEPSAADEELGAALNRDFSLFGVEDLGYDELPPLRTTFGELVVNPAHQVLLEGLVDGFSTGSPILALLEARDHRKGIWDGEGLWQWRAQEYLESGDFRAFDTFTGGLVQFLASSKRRKRLDITSETFYYNNNPVVVSAQYFDNNYVFDPTAELLITIKPRDGGPERQFPMLLRNNYYEVDLSALEAGDYEYSVAVRDQPVSGSGSFSILDFGVERQFPSADVTKLRRAATNTGGSLYFAGQSEDLQEDLLGDERFKALQKRQAKVVPLIDWIYLLALLAILLAAEWLIRKYNGLI